MQFIKARNLEAVFGLSTFITCPVKHRVRIIVTQLWTDAVHDANNGNQFTERNAGDVGVVLVTANDIREYVYSALAAAKERIQFATINSKFTVAQMQESIHDDLLHISAADYVISSLEGCASSETFIIYSNDGFRA